MKDEKGTAPGEVVGQQGCVETVSVGIVKRSASDAESEVFTYREALAVDAGSYRVAADQPRIPKRSGQCRQTALLRRGDGRISGTRVQARRRPAIADDRFDR